MIRNVVEHVVVANPEPADAELSEPERAEREAVRAMVLATGLPIESVTRSRRRRRAALVFAAVAACAAVVVGITASGRDATFVDRAYAAVTASGLFHVVTESSIDAPPGVFEHEPEWRAPQRTEAWYDRGDHASRVVLSERRGEHFAPWYEAAWKDGKQRSRSSGGAISESRDQTPPTDYYGVNAFEVAYRNAGVHDDGEIDVDGRRLRRLVLHTAAPGGYPGFQVGPSEQVMLFDPETLHPVKLTVASSITIDDVAYPVRMTTDYRTFERLPETAENLAKLDLR